MCCSNAPVSRLLPGEATTVIPSSPGFDEEDGVMESSQPLQESVDLQHLLANEVKRFHGLLYCSALITPSREL